MEQKTKKGLLIIGSLITLGGVIWYALKQGKKQVTAIDNSNTTPTTVNTASPNNYAHPTTGLFGGYTFPFKTIAQGNDFRAWVNKKYPDYARSIQLDVKGSLNSYVQKAWDKYGWEYKTILNTGGGYL
ncbi:MAG TPA: hypothetical protein PLN38_04795 [Chitinophagales bacterium]|nr:hypothetical protein [Chitinophagales bacterium]